MLASTTRPKTAYFAEKDSNEEMPLLKPVVKGFHNTEASVWEGEDPTSASPREGLLRGELLQQQQEPQPKPEAGGSRKASMVCNGQTRNDWRANAGKGKEGRDRFIVQSSSCLSGTVGNDDVISGGGSGLTAKANAEVSAKADRCWSTSSGEGADSREAFEEQEGKGVLEEKDVAVLGEDSVRAPTELATERGTEFLTQSADATPSIAVGGSGGGPSYDQAGICDEEVEEDVEERLVPCMLLLDSTKGHRSHDVFKGVRK